MASDEMKVSDLTVEGLHGLLREMQARKPNTIGDMSVDQFVALVVEKLAERSLKQSVAEEVTARKILADWNRLVSVGAVANPFRIQGMADLEKLWRDTLAPSVHQGAELIVAVAVAVKP